MGITFIKKEKKFVFDFVHDGAEDIISLTGNGYQVEAFGKCFYYGYEFSEQVDGSVRSAFIKYLKFTESLQDHPDLTNFIKKAVDDLDKQINLGNHLFGSSRRCRQEQQLTIYSCHILLRLVLVQSI